METKVDEKIIQAEKEHLINVLGKKLIDSDERDDRAKGYRFLARKYWPEEFLDGKRKHIHHIDFDNRNNVVSNLVVLTSSEHRKIHCLFDPKSQEAIRKASETRKGIHWKLSEETTRKRSEVHKGKHWKLTTYTRQKQSEAKKKYWEEKRKQNNI